MTTSTTIDMDHDMVRGILQSILAQRRTHTFEILYPDTFDVEIVCPEEIDGDPCAPVSVSFWISGGAIEGQLKIRATNCDGLTRTIGYPIEQYEGAWQLLSAIIARSMALKIPLP